MRALQAFHSPVQHDKIVRAILELYKEQSQLDKRLKLLEHLNTKKHHSTLLHKMLGDAYLASENTEKAALAYKTWLENIKDIKDESESNTLEAELHQLAEQLLQENKLPEIALAAAKHLTTLRSDPTYLTTLGNAYLVNGDGQKAFEQFERSFKLIQQTGEVRSDKIAPLLKRISHAHQNIKDTAHAHALMRKLIDSLPTAVETDLNTNLLLAEFCRELNLTDKAQEFMQEAGFFPETAWFTLGPFDNTQGVGYRTAFIPEEQTQIDLTTYYDGATGKIKWGPSSDKTLDGFLSFGNEEQFYTAYARISFTAPAARNAEIRFDSDDQGKVYLNGKKSVCT